MTACIATARVISSMPSCSWLLLTSIGAEATVRTDTAASTRNGCRRRHNNSTPASTPNSSPPSRNWCHHHVDRTATEPDTSRSTGEILFTAQLLYLLKSKQSWESGGGHPHDHHTDRAGD